jgi:hypothetical protein
VKRKFASCYARCHTIRAGEKNAANTPTKYTFFSSVVLGLSAIVIYFLDMFGAVEGLFHFAFWVAIAAWVAVMAGVAAKGV